MSFGLYTCIIHTGQFESLNLVYNKLLDIGSSKGNLQLFDSYSFAALTGKEFWLDL